MSKSCLECGCQTSVGVCSNCQEELFILENQGDCIVESSEGFMAAAKEQGKFLRNNKRRPWQALEKQ